MDTFWTQLPKPFFALAPMEDVTDAAFRRLIASCGTPDVFFSEFTSADGLVLAPEAGQKSLRKKLLYSEGERPIVAQLFSSVPERMEKAAALAQELGFDGVDINMGCPDKSVEKGGAGAALIKQPLVAKELIRAAKRGAPALPISVKTRIGYNKDELDQWLPVLLEETPAALTLHARTRKEMSAVPAHWDAIARAVQIRDAVSPKTLLLGNGDVTDLYDAMQKALATSCDGVMLGRAIYGNPWLFKNKEAARAGASQAEVVYVPTPEERMQALIRHLELYEELLGDTTHFAVMKKHFKAYISGWDHAKDLRMQLMETTSSDEARSLLADSNK